MVFRVEEDEVRRLVRVTAEGVFDKAEVVEMVARARETSARRRWNILYDMRSATLGKIGPGDVFWLPRQHPALRGADVASVRAAVLHTAALGEAVLFWENTFRNAGLQARAFTEEAPALEWLTRKGA